MPPQDTTTTANPEAIDQAAWDAVGVHLRAALDAMPRSTVFGDSTVRAWVEFAAHHLTVRHLEPRLPQGDAGR